MNILSSFHVLAYLYWLLLLIVTAASLVFAALAFRAHKQSYAVIAAGALATALFIAAVPVPQGPSSLSILLGMLALALAVVGGGPMAVLALRLATRNSVQPGVHGGIMVEQESTDHQAAAPAAHEVLRGGLAIGILERLAAAGAILAGFPEALAIVVAIKGVGRFTELAAAEARERFIIGTFASLIWACACAILVPLAAS